MAKRPPNILVVLTDEQRRDTLGCYGNPLCATPALDALAAGGMRCDECVVQHPLCMPSRATIMTGQYPSGHGVRANGVNLAPEVPLLTTTLKEAGYRTASFGKIHLNAWGGEHDAAASHENQAALATRRTVPPGYMGFDTVEVVGGHNETVYGPDYTDWLAARCPDGYGLMQIEHALDQPSGAWRTWNSALPAELHCTNWVVDRTLDYLRPPDDRPFLVFCSIPDPHPSFCPPAPYCYRYRAEEVPAPSRRDGELDLMPPHFKAFYEASGGWFAEHFAAGPAGGEQRTGWKNVRPCNRYSEHQMRDMVAHYWGMVALIDDAVGRLLAELDALGRAGDTVVVYTSDHGDLMGDHGLLMKGPFHYDGLLRVPSIWRGPGIVAGRSTTAPVGLVDLAPTLLDLAGVQPPASMQGRSLAPFLRGEAAPDWREGIVTENDDELFGIYLRTLTTDRWRLSCYGGQPYGELFDRREDPHELSNLWDDAGYAGIKRDLKELLLDQLLVNAPRREPRLAPYA